MIGTAAYRGLKLTSPSPKWLKQKATQRFITKYMKKIDNFIKTDLKSVKTGINFELKNLRRQKYACTFQFPPSFQD